MSRNIKIFFLIGFLFVFLLLACVPIALCMPSAPMVYVAGDGSGDFNCDGIDDHIEINQALQYVTNTSGFTTVYLKGPFTYIIADSILIGSNTILEGDSNAKIQLVSNARWSAAKPMIKENSSGCHDITVRGFTIDGNREGNTNVRSGFDYYKIFRFGDTQNIDINHMTLTNNHDDGMETYNCTNIKYHDNTLYSLGHDGLYAIYSSNVEAYNNNISCRINSGLRAYNSNHVNFHDNIITTVPTERSGGAGIEIEKESIDKPMDDIEICNNTIYQTMLAGVWIFGIDNYSAASANVHIHNNQIYDTGLDLDNKVIGGIVSSGFNALIENNVIDGAYGTGIMQSDVYRAGNPESSGLVVTVKNNIISNTQKSIAGGNGSGVYNLLPDSHSFVVQYNCFYNNTGSNYGNVEPSSSDIVADPLFADRENHNYHLKSKAGRWNGSSWVIDIVSSPCIDAGDPSSDYSKEPEDNGDRINIGPDGNTKYASKSGVYMPDNSSDSTDSSNGGSSHSGGSSGGGGAGGSPEPQSNVEIKELSQTFITKGQPVNFDFPQKATAVANIRFDSKKTVGKTTTIIEMLKNKSTLVSGVPADEVYMYLNIWVGNGGFATEQNIENAVVYFKVSQSWVKDKKIDKNTIALNRYNNSWHRLTTSLSSEDDNYLYFTAQTPGFSPFAITGKMGANGTGVQPTTGNKTQTETSNESIKLNTEQKTKQKETQSSSEKRNTSIPGFEISYGVVGLLAVFFARGSLKILRTRERGKNKK